MDTTRRDLGPGAVIESSDYSSTFFVTQAVGFVDDKARDAKIGCVRGKVNGVLMPSGVSFAAMLLAGVDFGMVVLNRSTIGYFLAVLSCSKDDRQSKNRVSRLLDDEHELTDVSFCCEAVVLGVMPWMRIVRGVPSMIS